MDFTYQSFQNLVQGFQQRNFIFTDYTHWEQYDRSVIMRHDIDFSIESSHCLSLLENKLGIKSTYFVLLSTGFYNLFQRQQRELLLDMQSRGFEIGLHFDESAYAHQSDIRPLIIREKDILSSILGKEITSFSYHRPSQQILAANITIPNMINSYSETFFKTFKYCSDSRFNWRDKPCTLWDNPRYTKFHILTHAFSWDETNRTPSTIYQSLIDRASKERYRYWAENIRHPEEFISLEEAKQSWGNL